MVLHSVWRPSGRRCGRCPSRRSGLCELPKFSVREVTVDHVVPHEVPFDNHVPHEVPFDNYVPRNAPAGEAAG